MSLLADHARPVRRRRVGRGWRIAAAIAIVLVAARLCLDPLVTHFVNRELRRIPDYAGSVKDVDVHLWRGAYRIQGLKLEKSSGKVPVPFFEAEAVDLSVQWRALLH